jgi:hypothetical protein
MTSHYKRNERYGSGSHFTPRHRPYIHCVFCVDEETERPRGKRSTRYARRTLVKNILKKHACFFSHSTKKKLSPNMKNPTGKSKNSPATTIRPLSPREYYLIATPKDNNRATKR